MSTLRYVQFSIKQSPHDPKEEDIKERTIYIYVTFMSSDIDVIDNAMVSDLGNVIAQRWDHKTQCEWRETHNGEHAFITTDIAACVLPEGVTPERLDSLKAFW